MDPILKWPGGKRAELTTLRPLYPAHTRLVEPFAGGAAVFCDLEPRAALVNDLDSDLIGLYRLVAGSDRGLHDSLGHLLDAWEGFVRAARDMVPPVVTAMGKPGFEADHESALTTRAVLARVGALSPANPFLSKAGLAADLRRGLSGKLGRIAASDKPYPEADAREQLVSGLLAGFYTHLRDHYAPAGPAEAAVMFWFIREMCYGSLFRYNKSGRFNIPYGGASYNSKDLRTKAELLAAPSTAAVFARANFSNDDFRAFFRGYGRGRASDFVFLDPPYDTTFSAYGNRSFGVREQTDLADVIVALRAPTLLVIKRTPTIEALYRDRARANPAIIMGSYERTYGVNIKSRFGRTVEHLVVANYDPPGPLTRI